MNDIIKAISELTPAERVELLKKIGGAIAVDADRLSVGQDPGNAHWDALTRDPEPAPASKARTITDKSIKKSGL